MIKKETIFKKEDLEKLSREELGQMMCSGYRGADFNLIARAYYRKKNQEDYK